MFYFKQLSFMIRKYPLLVIGLCSCSLFLLLLASYIRCPEKISLFSYNKVDYRPDQIQISYFLEELITESKVESILKKLPGIKSIKDLESQKQTEKIFEKELILKKKELTLNKMLSYKTKNMLIKLLQKEFTLNEIPLKVKVFFHDELKQKRIKNRWMNHLNFYILLLSVILVWPLLFVQFKERIQYLGIWQQNLTNKRWVASKVYFLLMLIISFVAFFLYYLGQEEIELSNLLIFIVASIFLFLFGSFIKDVKYS